MKILYISTLTSERKISEIFEQTGKNPGFATQKFNRLLAKGFIKNECDVTCLSAMPVPPEDIKSLFVKRNVETENGIKYIYCPFINTNILRKVSFLFYSFCFVLFWGLKNRKDKFVICDILNASISMGAVLASKINGLRSVGLFTDLPGMNMNKNKRIGTQFNDRKYLHWFSSYIFLTKQMDDIVNKLHKKFIILEGLTDASKDDDSLIVKYNERVILYAGALYEQYGLCDLIQAFMKLDEKNIRLYLFGSGPLETKIKEWSKEDNRIVFLGIRPTEEIEYAERCSTLLVNPRPSNEAFTQFSFPSKNMEYMSSGTPLLCTKLPGIPQEYFDYCYTVENETIYGFYSALKDILLKNSEELREKGFEAREFVINNKNNAVQSSRVIGMVQSLH